MNNSVISSANAQATVSGPVVVNFGFHHIDADNGYWAVDSITNGLVLSIPSVWDFTLKPSVIGPTTLDWGDHSIWTLPTLDASGVAVGQTGSGSFNYQVNSDDTTLDVLANAGIVGPSEGELTHVTVHLYNVAPAGQQPEIGSRDQDSNNVSSKFNVTIPTGAHVSQPGGAFAPTTENLTIQSGASLDTGGLSVVRHTFTNHGSGHFYTKVEGDFINDALSAAGNVAIVDGTIEVHGQLQNTGELQVPGALDLYSATSNAGTIAISSSGQLQARASFTNSGTISISGAFATLFGAGTVTNNGNLQWSDGYINGSLVNNSNIAITGNGGRTANGAITNYGTITHSSTQPANFPGGLTNAAGALYDLTNDGGVSSGTVTNAGTFRKSGGTGYSDISASFTNSGTIAVNSGNLAFHGLTLATTSTLQFQLSGTTPGTGYGNLYEYSTPNFSGALKITIAPGFSPALGNSFNLFDWSGFSSASGAFGTFQFPPLASGLKWDTSQLNATGVLSVVAGLPGDFNQNGVVDAPDYVLWRDNLGTIYAQADFNTWRSHFGQSVFVAASTSAVPEPQAIILCMIAICLAATRGRPLRPDF